MSCRRAVEAVWGSDVAEAAWKRRKLLVRAGKIKAVGDLEILVIGAPNLGEAPREDADGQRDWWAD